MALTNKLTQRTVDEASGLFSEVQRLNFSMIIITAKEKGFSDEEIANFLDITVEEVNEYPTNDYDISHR